MGTRLRGCVTAALVGILLSLATPAVGEVFTACWVITEHDVFGRPTQITRCRIAGGAIVDYASDDIVPSVLYPQPGTDLNGACWYYTSIATQYVIITQYPNGDADLGWDPNPGAPGGLVAIGFTYPRCTSEPKEATDPTVEVWQYVHQYVHPPPTPTLNPAPGNGVTGLDTYVGVPIPDTHSTTLDANGTTLQLYIEVSAIVIIWGDGERDTFPATSTAMAGYPDGIATHVYEVKNAEGVNLAVSYDWTARWRLPGGAWNFLAVPDTTTTVVYPVQEIVSDLTD